MEIQNLSETPSLLNSFISEIRDLEIQKDSMRFRRNIERIGEVLGFELSKSLSFSKLTTQTPLDSLESEVINDNIVICSILRAGLPLHLGLLNYFDKAENAFISAYRHQTSESGAFEIKVEYLACPDLSDKTLLLVDPMLATGQSIISTLEALKPFGQPKETHLVSVIGAQQGVDYVSKNVDDTVKLWIAAIDKELNERGYIVPGLGDAGDLSFGQKLQN